MTKPEITLDLKCQLFAHYLGQKVIFTGKGRPMRKLGSEAILTAKNLYLCCFLPQRALVLKPLSSITNVDAEAIYILSGQSDTPQKYRIEYGRLMVGEEAYNEDNGIVPWRWLNVFDYLRARGYALPWMGHDVADLIQYGWVQLEYDPQ